MKFYKFYLVLFLTTLALGCGKKVEADPNIAGSKSPSNGGTTTGGNGQATVAVADGRMFLELATPAYTSHTLHGSESDFSKKCEITKDSTGSDRFIDCYIEVEELDLMFHGLAFNFTASRTCEFVEYQPYYYLKAPFGYGPSAVSYTEVDGTVNSSTAVNADGTGKALCSYNYSLYQKGAPNCCIGTYVKTVTSVNTSAGTSTTSSTFEEWGGEYGNCLAGAGLSEPLDKSGVPRPTIYANSEVAGQGLLVKKSYDGTITTPANVITNIDYQPAGDLDGEPDYVMPSDWPMPRTHHFSNHYVASTGWNSTVNTTSMPPALALGSPNYYFACLDSAREELARVTIHVREWSAKGLIAQGADSRYPQRGVTADPGDPLVPAQPLNDYYTWDDLIPNASPYTDDTAVPAAGSTNTFLPDAFKGYPYVWQ